MFSSSDVGLAFLAAVRGDLTAIRLGESLGSHGGCVVMFLRGVKVRQIKVLW